MKPMTERARTSTPSTRRHARAGIGLALLLGAALLAGLARTPAMQEAAPAERAAALPARAAQNSSLPAYFPRLEVSPEPSLAWRSQLGGATRAVALRERTVFFGLGARVLAYDATDPDAPVELGRSPLLPGVVEDIQLAGNLAWLALGDAGIAALDIAQPGAMRVLGRHDTPGRSLSLHLGPRLSLLADESQLLVLDLRDPAALRELGRWPVPGRAVHVTGRDGIAFLTDEDVGLHVLDLGDPASPRLLDVVDVQGPANTALAYGNALYLNMGRGIHVLDATDPARLSLVGQVDVGEDRGTTREGMAIAQSGLIADGRLYDLSDPWAPRRISGPESDTKGTDLVRGHAIATDGTLVVAARESEDGGFILGDLTDPRAPRRRGGLRTVGRISRGELHALPDGTALELAGSRIDVSDPDRPLLAGASDLPPGTIRLDGRWGIRNLQDDASRPGVSMELLTLQQPARRVPVPALPEEPWQLDSAVMLGAHAWIAGQVSFDPKESPFPCPIVAPLDLRDPEQPRWAGRALRRAELPGEITSMAGDARTSKLLLGHGMLLCDGHITSDHGLLSLVDAADPSATGTVQQLKMPALVHDIETWRGSAFVAADAGGLRVLDLAGPGAPREIAQLDLGGAAARHLELAWPYLWLGTDRQLRLVDVREPARPRALQRLDVPSEILSMTMLRRTLWLATSEAGLLGYEAGP